LAGWFWVESRRLLPFTSFAQMEGPRQASPVFTAAMAPPERGGNELIAPCLINVSDLSAAAGQHRVMSAEVPIQRRSLLRLSGAICATGAVLGAVPSAIAGSHRDHDRAREALEHGEALPLAEILARVRPELDGEVVGVSFEREGGRWIYQFKLVGRAGRLAKIYVDAATARVLKRKAE